MIIKMMLFSDLHLQMNDPFGTPTSDGLTTRVQQKLKSLERVVDLAVEHECKWIVDLGDTFNSINPASKLRNAYAREIRKAQNKGIFWRRVVGNHETDGREPDGLDAGIVSDKYSVISGIDWGMDIKSMYIPEVNYELINKALTDYPEDMVIGHFGVAGATYPSGLASDVGIPQALFVDREFPSFLGHIHKRQTMVAGNVVYIGALCKHNFGDRNIPTGCCLVTIECGDTPVAVGLFNLLVPKNVGYEFIEVPDIGLYKLVFTEGDEKAFSQEIDAKLGDIVKIIYNGSQEWYVNRDKTLESTLIKMGVKIMMEFNPTPSGSVLDDSLDVNDIDIKKLVIAAADDSGKDAVLGLNYLQKALEV